MSARNLPLKYGKDSLNQYCYENNIVRNKQNEPEIINRETMIEAYCLNCSSGVKKTFRMLLRTGCFCKQCTENKRQEKIKATNIKRFGYKNPFQNETIKEKIKATNMKRLGCENPLKNKDIREKMKATNIKRYGCDNPFQNEDIKEKIKVKNIKKFGYEHPMKNENVKNKLKLTNLQRFGYEYATQNKSIKEKIKKTCMQNFGYEHPMKNAIFFEKQQKACYKCKKYRFPSGRIDLVQGYEPQALNILITMYKEDDIVTKNTEIELLCGEIKYIFEEKESKYHTDIYIKSEHKFIEVKSSYIFNLEKERNLKKREACINTGIKFEFWIMDVKGNCKEKF